MKNLFIYIILCLTFSLTAQSDTETEVTTEGLMLPRLTTTDRDAITTAASKEGLLLYDLGEKTYYYYDGASWQSLGASPSLWEDSTSYITYPGPFISVRDTSEANVFDTEVMINSQELVFSSTEEKDHMVYAADSLTSNTFSGNNVILTSTMLTHRDGATYSHSDATGFEVGLLDSGSGDIKSAELNYTPNGGQLLVSDAAGNNTVVITQNNGGYLQINNAAGDSLLTVGSNNINDAGLITLVGNKAKIDLNGLDFGYKAGGHTGIDGDVIPYNSTSYDLGNNLVGQHWDDVVANTFTTFSDARLKENIAAIPSSLDRLNQLKPVTYRYKKEVDFSQEQRAGLLAQEVQKIFPEIVNTEDIDIDKEGNVIVTKADKLSMNYMDLIPHLIKGMQEQQAMIATLQKEIEQLKKTK